jgi:hypothetical protein
MRVAGDETDTSEQNQRHARPVRPSHGGLSSEANSLQGGTACLEPHSSGWHCNAAGTRRSEYPSLKSRLCRAPKNNAETGHGR